MVQMVRTAFLLILTATLLLLAACADDNEPTATMVATAPPTNTSTPEPESTSIPDDPTPTPEMPTAAATETRQPEPTSEPATTSPDVELDGFDIALEEVATGLEMPVGIVAVPDGSNRLFIVEKNGTIAILTDGLIVPEKLLDIRDRVNAEAPEQGLLGLALHPQFASNGLLYVNYTDSNGDTVIARFQANETRDQADPAGEVILLQIEQPANNHNGGNLEFGPDGFLYIGTGDGGGSGDTFDQAQNGQTLLGKMLRIDVDAGDPYAIPPDNPFVDDPDVLDEIWAIGLRNPWRYSFDTETGDLFIADVGQNQIEEINVQPAGSTGGGNYGWPILEGSECFEADNCDSTGLVLPIFQYDHAFGCSVTGGDVYRGETWPELAGIYFLSDFCSGNIWALAPDSEGWQSRLLLESGHNISAFGTGTDGALLLVDMYQGSLFQVVVAE